MEFTAIVPVPETIAGTNAAAAFAPLAGEPPLVRVVRAALGAEATVVVPVVDTLVEDCRKSLAAHNLPPVSVIPAGGPTRAHCVAAALDHTSTHFTLVHDIRRPLTSSALQARVIAELRAGSPIVMPFLPLTDSVKAVDAQGSVTATLDRSTLQTVQYPRGFTTERLSQLLAHRTSDDFDELEEAVYAGAAIAMVGGEPDAFVVQLPKDTAFVEAIIASRQ